MKNETLEVFLGKETVALLKRSDITDIYINDEGIIWYISQEEGKVKTNCYRSPESTRALIEMLAGLTGKIVNEEFPSLACEIAEYRARFQGELPPIVRQPQFNIRKQATKIFTLDSYLANKAITSEKLHYLKEVIKNRKNILIAGGTGSGKTTLLNAVLAQISKDAPLQRVISIEDLPELQCSSADYAPMFTKQLTEKNAIDFNMTRILSDSLRRNPDRIIIGEVRDGAAYTMLKAWNTGHEGGACTVHANNPVASLTRLESLAGEDSHAQGELKELIGEVIDVVVGIRQIAINKVLKKREINEIIEVQGFDRKTNEYIIRKI